MKPTGLSTGACRYGVAGGRSLSHGPPPPNWTQGGGPDRLQEDLTVNCFTPFPYQPSTHRIPTQLLRLQVGVSLSISQVGTLRPREMDVTSPSNLASSRSHLGDLSVRLLLLSLVTRCPCWLWMRCTRTCPQWSGTCIGMIQNHNPPTQPLPPSLVVPLFSAPPSISGGQCQGTTSVGRNP